MGDPPTIPVLPGVPSRSSTSDPIGTDKTFGICQRDDGQLRMRNKVIQREGNKLEIDGIEYELTPTHTNNIFDMSSRMNG